MANRWVNNGNSDRLYFLPRGFPRVAAGFSNYDGEFRFPLVLSQGSPFFHSRCEGEHALEKEMATHSSVLAWRIPGTGDPGRLPSMGSHRVGHDWSDLAAGTLSTHKHTNYILPVSILLSLKAELRFQISSRSSQTCFISSGNSCMSQ